MDYPKRTSRRTVLKTIGPGLAATTLAGTAFAGDTGDNRRQDTFAWGEDSVYEMLESEPPEVYDHVDSMTDAEGAHQSHRPLWLIESMDGTGVPGSTHSPHPAPGPVDVDHVIPVPSQNGGSFSAQWHVHLVLDELFDPTLGLGNLQNLTNTDGDGNYLISADAIGKASDVFVVPIIDPETGEPEVFTCPARPHKHN